MSSIVRRAGLATAAAALALTGAAYGVARSASADVVAELTAPQLVADMGAGWNLGNQLEANNNGIPSETAWGNPVVTQALIDRVKASGFKTIRIPVSYLGNIGAGPNYTVSSAWLTRIAEVVNYAYNQGLYVMINMHGDGYKSVTGSWLICDSSDQTTIKDKYQKVWQQVATKFSSYNDHLIFESMNEEFDGQYGTPTSACYSNINAYNQIFVDTVRKTGGTNASRWLLVPGWNTNIEYTAGSYGFVLPTDTNRSSSIPSAEQRLMISVHYYDPWDFAGQEDGTITQWGAAATNAAKKSTWGQEDYMDTMLKKMYDAFVTKGYPVFVGEYGSIDKTTYDSANNTYRANYAKALVATAKKYGAATAYWDNGYNGQHGFGLFDRTTNTVTQQSIISAIITAAGSSTPTTSPTTAPTTTPTSAPTTTPTTAPTTSPGGTSTCKVTNAVSAWNTGLTNNVTITNTGTSAINGWTLSFTLAGGQTITSGWNATYSPTSGAVTATNVSYNGGLSAGGSASIGYQATHTGNAAAPTGFKLNGATCS
ncbi:cellulase family glycosylhydrolase [Actinoplanes sp. NPDC026619]|uniref:cellulase family glycosylhydrolase n=1 Tax=Actinoplanes sp. NPDC026619 TaxID=3155798 RepID=UPI0033CFC01A